MSLLNSFTQRILLEKDEEKKKKTEEEITSPEDIEPEELDAAPGGDEEASPDAEDKDPSIVTTDEDNVDVPEPEEDDDIEETPEEDDVDVPEPEGDDEPTADDTPTEEPGAGGGEVLQAPGAGNDETGDVDDPPNFEDDNDAGDGGNAASTGDSPEGGNTGGDEADVDIPEPDNDSGAGGGDEEPDSGDAENTDDEEPEGDDEESDVPVGSIQADIKKIEDELFEELSPEQKAIKNKELKQQFVRLYYVIERFKEKVDTINKNSDNIQIISRVGDSLDKLSKLVKYYIIVTYNTKSYFENKSDIYYCLWALDRINKLICTIAPEDSGL